MIEQAIQSGVIEPTELHDLLSGPDAARIKLIDSTFVLPSSAENPYQNYLKNRIGNAVFFDIKAIADHDSPLPHMLPSTENFASAVSKLGISNDDIVITYGQSGIAMGASRAWWSFRAFGHDNVCVLNGGLPAWVREGFSVNTELPTPPTPSTFEATYREYLVAGIDEVKGALDGPTHIFDARPGARFSGETPEPREGMRAGHIPGSQNIPCVQLLNQETGKLKPNTDLDRIFDAAGYKTGAPVISTCGSGVTACVIALALFHLGHQNTPVYDGAWSEWGAESSGTPIKTTP